MTSGDFSASVSAGKLAESVETYLVEHPAAALLEDGRLLFDMRRAHFSVNESHGRCLLQLWSDERNLVRTVIEVRERAQSLRLMTRRMGAAKPQALELVPTNDRRTPTTRDAARRTYQRMLERVLSRSFLGSKVDGFRSAMDLEHSFGPAYVRGRLLRGTAADAVIGVSETESAAIIDGILTLGILWLDYCRKRGDGRRHFGGLKVVVPPGAGRTTAERMAWLNPSAAEFQLFTLDPRSEELEPGGLSGHRQYRVAPRARVFANGRNGTVPAWASIVSSAFCTKARSKRSKFARVPAAKSVCSSTGSNSRAFAMGRRPHRLRLPARPPLAPAPTKRRLPTRTKLCAANSSCGFFIAAIPAETTTTPSSACSPSGGLNPACARTLPMCCPACAAIFSIASCPHSQVATAACSTC